MRSNCKNNKEEGKETYNDLNAGYCRHIGQKKGVGYDPRILYAFSFNRWFPVYFKMFPGNRNDTVTYRKTLDQFLTITDHDWIPAIADSGPYCEQNLQFTQFKGLLPIIRAKKNLKTHPIRELKENFFFNTEYIPKEWTDEFFLKVYSFRPMIEQGNAANTTYYNAFRMNTRGMEAAIKLRSYLYILDLLKALTAYKLGRPDLIIKYSAFGSSWYFNFRSMLPFLARDAGFQIFPFPV
jgi:hypothetical protein